MSKTKDIYIIDDHDWVPDLLKKDIKPILPKGFKFVIDKTRKCWIGYVKKEE